ncbi:PAS domain S-box protein [Rhizobacter sp. SG703]|uniref:PAS domain S-box protein n=1 Tax=Rhizobacter sp. SG703 TaxID=2587140 RepID=UPI0014452472|nr:PAS domain S-box protein [Rhizobacter sp. SG703]NKI94180.1 PAS domain S-box-containing protein [Rhizobacter sp. SG703]
MPPHRLPPPTPEEGRLFRSLFSAYPDALLLVDAQGLIVRANPAAAGLLGYQVEELVGLPVDALVPDSIRPRHAAYRGAYGMSPKPRPMGTQLELTARRKDGSEVIVEIALSPVQDDGLPFVVAAIRGIAAYPRVQQALQQARYSEHVAKLARLAVDTRDPQALLRQVPQIAAEGLQVETAVVYLLEPNCIEFRLAAGVGLEGDEVEGRHVPNRPDTPPGFVLSEGRPVVVSNYARETRFKVPPDFLARGLVSGLGVPLSERGSIVGVLAVRSREARRFGDDELRFLDSLSSLLAASLQRAQTEDQLNHAQRMESVGQLTGGIAHDFNNLLTVIQGNLQVLEYEPPVADEPRLQQMLGAATRAAKRGAELTGKLLAFSRRQRLVPTRVEPALLLRSLADMLHRTLDERVQIVVDAPDGCPGCRADPGQLESALLNIAINARDAMPDGGTLSFACRPCRRVPAPLVAELGEAAQRDDGFVEISVSDTGHGMSEAVRDRAFEPFFTTKEAGRGTGLGLSTVYGFARQSNGAVALDSAPGAGTRVTLYLPRFDLPSLAEARGEALAALPPGLRVMVVEDDPEVLAVCRTFLLALKCEVTAHSSAEPALAALEQAQPIDLLLSDVILGAGLRGTDLARRAKVLRPALAVLLMSGYSSEAMVGDGVGLPWELLRKPYSREELSDAMVRAMVRADLRAAVTAAPATPASSPPG